MFRDGYFDCEAGVKVAWTGTFKYVKIEGKFNEDGT